MLLNRLISSYQSRFQYTRSRLSVLGWVGFIGFPAYYFIWTYIFPQPYENLSLRALASIMYLGLALSSYVPKRFERWVPLYAYACQLYGLGIYFIFMLLMNQSNAVWSVSAIMALFFMILFVDALNVVVMYAISVITAWLIFMVAGHDIPLNPVFYQLQPVFLLAILGGALFNYSESMIVEEKRRAMVALASNIAHEIRTPLATIRSVSNNVKIVLPKLIDVYEKHGGQQDGPRLNQRRIDAAIEAPSLILREIDEANQVIDILLANINTRSIEFSEFSKVDAEQSVKDAIDRFTYPNESKISYQVINNFQFSGNSVMFVYQLFNLFRNANYAIHQKSSADQGEITVRIDADLEKGYVHVRDNGVGIDQNMLENVFKEFYTSKSLGVGTGLGLSYCLRVQHAFGGTIEASSEKGEYTEFTLAYPRLTEKKG